MGHALRHTARKGTCSKKMCTIRLDGLCSGGLRGGMYPHLPPVPAVPAPALDALEAVNQQLSPWLQKHTPLESNESALEVT